MKIDHIAIYVTDLKKTRRFYEHYFGGVSNEKYHNQKTGLQTYFLTFPDGGRLELMARPDTVARKKQPLDEGFIHLAFSVGSRESVDSLTEQLRQDGHAVHSEPRVTGDGYYESSVLDPEGNLIEIVG